jgi:hypothetical protein
MIADDSEAVKFLYLIISSRVVGDVDDKVETHFITKTDLLRSIFKVRVEIKVKAISTETNSFPLKREGEVRRFNSKK